jgi:hypothetical protein
LGGGKKVLRIFLQKKVVWIWFFTKKKENKKRENTKKEKRNQKVSKYF